MEFCNDKYPDKADTLMNVLFRRYFQDAEDVSKVDILAQSAIEAGLSDESEVRQVLSSDAYKAEVQQQLSIARQMRVSGVPFVIIESNSGARPTNFSGAQPPEVIGDILVECSES